MAARAEGRRGEGPGECGGIDGGRSEEGFAIKDAQRFACGERGGVGAGKGQGGVVAEAAVADDAGDQADIVGDGADGSGCGEGKFNRNLATVNDDGAAVVVLSDQLPFLGGERWMEEESREELAFIASGVLVFEGGIEVMAQFFREHGQDLRVAGVLQPVRIEIDGAGAGCIGASGSAHGGTIQQLDGGQAGEITAAPAVDGLAEGGGLIGE